MSLVAKSNPYNESRTVTTSDGLPFSVTCMEIWKYLTDMGFTHDVLDAMVPKIGETHLGNLYGFSVWLDTYGQFQLKNGRNTSQATLDKVKTERELAAERAAYLRAQDEKRKQALIEEMYGDDEEEVEECDHGFLVVDHDDQGNKFHCKMCGERWPHHPDSQPTTDKPRMLGIHPNAMSAFRGGLETLAEAAKRASMTMEEFAYNFKLTMQPKYRYENIYQVGKTVPQTMMVDTEPTRTSCPKEIDDEFSNMGHTLDDMPMLMQKFPDVKGVTSHQEATAEYDMEFYMDVEFIDGSTQKVYPDFSL